MAPECLFVRRKRQKAACLMADGPESFLWFGGGLAVGHVSEAGSVVLAHLIGDLGGGAVVDFAAFAVDSDAAVGLGTGVTAGEGQCDNRHRYEHGCS